jgi:hypothetical protein
MATSESIIYLLESRFSPLMKKGCVAEFCKQQQQQQQQQKRW